MYHTMLVLTGGLIALMLSLNGKLSSTVSLIPALILIHATGLLAAMLLPNTKPAQTPASPLGLYGAGLLGIGLTLADLACVTQLGVTLTVALRLMGQLLGAYLIDLKGLPGLPRQVAGAGRLLTLMIAAIGCLVMSDLKALAHWAVWIAVLAGLGQSLSSALNAALGSYIGTIKAVRVNFSMGLLGCLVLLGLSDISLLKLAPMLLQTPWPILFGGGLCAVLVVSGTTLCFRHVSLLTATLLLFLGQLVFASLFDLLSGQALSFRMILGGVIMLSGLAAEGLWPVLDKARKPLLVAKTPAGRVFYNGFQTKSL